ncbi:hypothetical protein FC62_GL000367 [Amylolactobacillus amylotrophicus DSM 20534]|uniref:Uncharacterized protein n=3 Tax=Amylolactobacillus TaxID=2767876 RepID=A0A1L6XDK0_9LACO|nr:MULTISPECIES: hypothetical protein [Amylolactobacillus]APT19054.1 hypothetical protein LA20533_07270 [Amylolactobacillus amylophilus DSM 20533 = JCM 1125]KRK38679.1 hypothetical protein FC62_GL000367 [Amylolactobacillus amylotrophicus DSM 20534]KRM42678.1 hypothetical protein FD40_GL000472 [Amylolactobacillus amylophilus DSM 20533 = JCM 1125]GED79537.1 hypothetical protein LAM01_00100 [Amylolactobacillus amylophilus]
MIKLSKSRWPLFKSLQKKTDNLNLIFREGLTGVRVIRSLLVFTIVNLRVTQKSNLSKTLWL